jgi:hypothetical protein
MARAVSRRPVTAEARTLALVSPCGICGGRSGTKTGFLLVSSAFPCQHYSTVAVHTHITCEMNNRPVGGCSSETSSHAIGMKSNMVLNLRYQVKAVPLHAMEALGGRGGIAPTHSRPRH